MQITQVPTRKKEKQRALFLGGALEMPYTCGWATWVEVQAVRFSSFNRARPLHESKRDAAMAAASESKKQKKREKKAGRRRRKAGG